MWNFERSGTSYEDLQLRLSSQLYLHSFFAILFLLFCFIYIHVCGYCWCLFYIVVLFLYYSFQFFLLLLWHLVSLYGIAKVYPILQFCFSVTSLISCREIKALKWLWFPNWHQLPVKGASMFSLSAQPWRMVSTN